MHSKCRRGKDSVSTCYANVLADVCFVLQSVEFHERGKNHKENVAAKISEVMTITC